MNKRYLILCVFTFLIYFAEAQNFFSEQEENLIFYSPEIAPTAVCVGDIEGDGDTDILSFFDKKFRLYTHSDGKGTFDEQEIISNPHDWILSVFITDLNGDGKQDVLAASYNNDKIIWYENEGENGYGLQITISDSTKGASSVYAADLDNDGDQDVISASIWDNKIAWYENKGDGIFGEQQIITTLAKGARYVYVSDLNGDSLPDVISASIYDNKIAWYENKGEGNFGEQQIISDTVARALSIYSADLNGDGSQDVLSASSWDNKIAWYKNDGEGNFGTQQVISDALESAQSVYSADMDNDGDQDVLSASLLDDKIAWYENDGNGNFGIQQVVTNFGNMPGFVYVTDIDGDGYKDIISASTDFKIAWYQNTLPLKMVANPKDTAVLPNSDAVFTIIADSATGYQWQYSNGGNFLNLSDNNVYAGVHTNTLKITGATFTLQKNKYRCVTINGSDSLNSTAAILTIIDTESPVITSTHPDTIIQTEANCIALLPDYSGSIEANDNSNGTLVITQTPVAWSKVFDSGVEVILTVTDEAENSSQISFNVNKADETAPVISGLLGTQQLEDIGNGQFIVPDYTDKIEVTDNCSGDSAINIVQEPAPHYVIPDSVFKILVTLSATDEAGNSTQVSFEAKATDSIPPQITSSHNDLILEANYNCEAYLPNFRGTVEATDNFDKFSELYINQSPAPYSFITGKDNKVTLTVTDKAKNSAEITFNVEVKDNVKPVITCIRDQNLILERGQEKYTVSGAKFDLLSIEDNCEIVLIKNNINDSSTLNQFAFPLDTTNVIWTATDKGGNIAQCSFKVIVNKLVGLETFQEHGISVYPNPTTGDIFIDSSVPVQQLQILDLKGSILMDRFNLKNKDRINIATLKSGTYILRITTENEDYNLKIMKE